MCGESFYAEDLEPTLELCMKIQRSTGVNGRMSEYQGGTAEFGPFGGVLDVPPFVRSEEAYSITECEKNAVYVVYLRIIKKQGIKMQDYH